MRLFSARRLLGLVVLAVLGACWSARLAGIDDPGPRGVLFIGNSHTYVDDAPGLVRSLERMAGDEQLEVERVVQGNHALEDHWIAGRAEELLRAYPWAFVVMQQGPSSLFESRIHLRQWTQQFSPLIRAAGAQAVLYQIWPTIDRRADAADAAADALTSYTNAAASVNGLLTPAGDAFTLALEVSPALPVTVRQLQAIAAGALARNPARP